MLSVNRLDTGNIRFTMRENDIGELKSDEGCHALELREEEKPTKKSAKICQIMSNYLGELAMLVVAPERRRST